MFHHFFTALKYNVVYLVLINIVDIICCCLYHSRGNFCGLIYHVSTCIGKVVTAKKAAMLPLSFLVCTSIDSFGLPSFFFSAISYFNRNCSGSMARNPEEWFFLFQQFYQMICLIFLSTMFLTVNFINFVHSKYQCNKSFWILR